MEQLICELYNINCIKFGDFKLKNKKRTPIIINFSKIISYPKILENQVKFYGIKLKNTIKLI